MATIKHKVETKITYTLKLSAKEAKGLRHLLSNGISGGTCDGLGLDDLAQTLEDAFREGKIDGAIPFNSFSQTARMY
jgi:hypothetical protein